MLYSEIFKSMQGEGLHTGRPSMWIRFFLCNLNCDGFGQKDPTDPSTYQLPYQEIDVSSIKKITDLPVFERGCDSSYSWAAKFKHLQHDESVEEVLQKIEDQLPIPGVWNDYYNYHMVFTGGEPLLKHNQKNMIELLDAWSEREDPSKRPAYFTIESNGTKVLSPELAQAFANTQQGHKNSEVFMSFSPKLYSTSGEPNKRAIKPDNIVESLENLYRVANMDYQLKFVIGDRDEQWEEMENVIDQIGIGRDKVWIMPVGGTLEAQQEIAAAVCDRAIDKGYNVSARVHNYIWSNVIGK